jgi:hypothetical protein
MGVRNFRNPQPLLAVCRNWQVVLVAEVAVSLEGSLETITLTDVLALLSVTAKTGELRIEGTKLTGRLWFDSGLLSGYDVGNNKTEVDALFALMRLTEGNFTFHAGAAAPSPFKPGHDVAPFLAEADRRLDEWDEIVDAVPSVDHTIKLDDRDRTQPVTLRPDQWRLVVAIGEGRVIQDVLDQQNLGEFDGSKAVKELLDLAIVTLGPPPVAPPARPASPAWTTPVADLSVTQEVTTTTGYYDEAYDGADYSAGEYASSEYPSSDYAGGEFVSPEYGPQHPDGLADRGPWTASELAQLEVEGGWDESRGQADAESWHAEEPEEPAVGADGDPVNRGLLLKFLGSVRQ